MDGLMGPAPGVEPSPILSRWDEAVRAYADAPAIDGSGGSATLSFAEADDRSRLLAGRLAECGLRPGEAIVLCLPRGPGWLVAMLAGWRAGGVLVPASQPASDLLADRTGARFRIVDALAGRIEPAGSGAVRSHPALLADHAYALSTSGSSGFPKLALVTHRTCAAVLAGLAQVVAMEPGEHALHIAAFTFSSSIRQLFLPLLSGARVTVLESGATGGFSPGRLLEVAAGRSITSLDLTPSHLRGLVEFLEADRDGPRPTALRRLLVASETLPPPLARRWRRVLPGPHQLLHLWGQTETGGALSARPLADLTGDAAGTLPLGSPFAPFIAHWQEHSEGTAELLLAGLDSADGLLGDDGLDRSRYDVRDPAGAPLYRTGDLFRREAGRLYFAGRVDQQVKMAGIRVDLAELERKLCLLPGVAAAVAATVARPAGGTLLGVGYLAGEAADPAQALADTAGRWRAEGLPAPRFVRLDALPLTRSGKLDRLAVAAVLAERLTGPGAAAASDPLLELWQRHTDVAGGAAPTPNFFQAGGDSMSMIGLLAELHSKFGVRLTPERFHRDPTLAALRAEVAGIPIPVATATAAEPLAVIAEPGPAADRRQVGSELAPTALQRGIWLAEKLGGDPAGYWLTIELAVPGRLDLGRLTAAFELLLQRYDALRIGFTEDAGELTVVPEAWPANGQVEDWLPRGADPPLSLARAGRLIQLAVEPAEQSSRLRLRVHHAVADRRSLITLLGALSRFYDHPDDLPAAPPSFVRWMAEQHELARGPLAEAATRYWRQCLPEPAAPVRSAAADFRRTSSWQRRTQRQPVGASRHTAWLSALRQGLDQHGTGLAELIGIDVDLRTPQQGELVGACVNVQPVVLPALHADEPAVRQVGAAVTAMLPYAGIPIASVVPPGRRPTGDPRQPFFRSRLVYQASDYPQLSMGARPVRYLRTPPGIAEHTVTLFVRESADRIDTTLSWDLHALDAATGASVLDAAVRHFDQALAAAP